MKKAQGEGPPATGGPGRQPGKAYGGGMKACALEFVCSGAVPAASGGAATDHGVAEEAATSMALCCRAGPP